MDIDELEPIYEWDPKNLIDYATVIVTARRRSGKTVFAKNVISVNRKRYDEIYIFSSTINKPSNSEEYSFIPPRNRYSYLDEDKIREIISKQDEIMNYNKSRPKKDHVKSHVCIIFDDILTDAKFRKPNNVVSQLFVEGRHSMIGVFCLVQSFSGREGVSPVLRKNADLIVSFFQHNINDRKAMAEQFLSLQNATVGAEYLRRITNEEHTACIIDVNNVGARSYSEYVFKYKAPNKKLKKFMIGNKDLKVRNTMQTINPEVGPISTQKVASRTKPRKPCKLFQIRTAEQIDFSKKSINCDEGYNI